MLNARLGLIHIYPPDRAETVAKYTVQRYIWEAIFFNQQQFRSHFTIR